MSVHRSSRTNREEAHVATAVTTENTVIIRQHGRPGSGVLLAEFLGSMVLGIFGYWAIFSGKGAPWGLVDGAMAFGIGMFVVALIFGAHANPLVSVSAWMAWLISGADAALRFVAQLIGFIVALLLMWWMFGDNAPATHFAVTTPRAGTLWITALFIGLLAGFGFALPALWAVDRLSKLLGALVLGLALYTAIYYSAALAGGGVNTARELASMFFSGEWPLWGTIGELLGAVLAGLLYRKIRQI